MNDEKINIIKAASEVIEDNKITFHLPQATEAIITLNKEGFHYKGKFIEDAGEAHGLLLTWLKTASTINPTKYCSSCDEHVATNQFWTQQKCCRCAATDFARKIKLDKDSEGSGDAY